MMLTARPVAEQRIIILEMLTTVPQRYVYGVALF
jgi:hypothetical protein